MQNFLRPALIVCLALLVPIVPFLFFGEQVEAAIARWLDPPPSAALVAVATIVALASDILLPIPSSLVSTVAGARLGVLAGTAASWLGMTAGASLGFYLARTLGRPIAERLSRHDDLERMDRLADRYGSSILIFTRALPVLAEAAVLLLGAMRLPWRQFLPAVTLSNLGLSLAYCALGSTASESNLLPWALALSIALPVAATAVARLLLR